MSKAVEARIRRLEQLAGLQPYRRPHEAYNGGASEGSMPDIRRMQEASIRFLATALNRMPQVQDPPLPDLPASMPPEDAEMLRAAWEVLSRLPLDNAWYR